MLQLYIRKYQNCIFFECYANNLKLIVIQLIDTVSEKAIDKNYLSFLSSSAINCLDRPQTIRSAS